MLYVVMQNAVMLSVAAPRFEVAKNSDRNERKKFDKWSDQKNSTFRDFLKGLGPVQ
jgi:hypothetical protein